MSTNENGMKQRKGKSTKEEDVSSSPVLDAITEAIIVPIEAAAVAVGLADWADAPAYLQHNKWITAGYRVNYTFKKCAKSIFQIHNETFEIWTHLLATAFFLFAWVPVMTRWIPEPGFGDYVVMSVFFVCTILQMLNSTIFHIFNCQSPNCYMWTARLDYSGISIMIIGCYIPPLYYGFVCYPNIGLFYICTFLTLGLIGVCIGLIPIFNTPRFIIMRISLYLTIGWCAIIPVVHLSYLMTFSVVWNEGGKGLLMMGLLYSIGATFYASRTPERFFKEGTFNMSMWSSHVVWHYFTIAAALVHLWTCIHLSRMSRTIPCPSDSGVNNQTLQPLHTDMLHLL
eukprot:TRINITY_DN11799_c0_g1_i1.p1 TRINITY_DN11799_c0_g1~~TRINITY_DN11799_c0_g1_i1.p1  ORF type:complete len:341 (-),score=23.15 TRINITY_DN11799_c0_g1_i1:69-1091(-)